MVNLRSRCQRWKFGKARAMRKDPTPGEAAVWAVLRKRRANGRGEHWRRQSVRLGYIPDFYSHSLKLIIEVDGRCHQSVEARAYDAHRDAAVLGNGIRTIRLRYPFEVPVAELIESVLG